MRFLATIFLISLTIVSCKQAGSENDNAFAKADSENTRELATTKALDEAQYASYGRKISLKNILTKSKIAEKYEGLAQGDTAIVKFKAPIHSVCTSKGCWMRLDITDEEQAFVKFKDYGFFVPTDTKEGHAIVEGKAFLEEVSVDELRHLAQDAGKTKEEIAAITEPHKELRFIAEGVLIQSK